LHGFAGGKWSQGSSAPYSGVRSDRWRLTLRSSSRATACGFCTRLRPNVRRHESQQLTGRFQTELRGIRMTQAVNDDPNANRSDDLRFRLTRLDTEMRTAFDVLNQRITWLMISHSSLFAAFVSLLDKPPSIITRSLIWIVPCLGVVSALLVSIAAVAKDSIIRSIKGMRSRVENEAASHGYEPLEGKGWAHSAIYLPSSVLPWLLLALWIVILVLNCRA